MSTTKRGLSRIPLMTDDERANGLRGFYIVDSTHPLPEGSSAYRLFINADAVITVYEERKADGAGNRDMLVSRNLNGVTILSLNTLTAH